MTEALFLIKNGIPFDVAFSLDAELRSAMCLRFSIFAGKVFDRETMQLRDRREGEND